jgi:hypothetical protein
MESRLYQGKVNSEQLSTSNTTCEKKKKKKKPILPHTQEKKGGPFTSWRDFSLVAWKFYS